MTTLRVIGDVHAQIDEDSLCLDGGRPYLKIISDVSYSIQLGDMGDEEAYDRLIANVDASRHRFIPGNHEHYDRLPPHSLGDFGAMCWGGVHFFFIRGAASTDREKLIRLGSELGRKLWYEQEELTDEQMATAELEYLEIRPRIVLSHDAPTEIARLAWQHALRPGRLMPNAVFHPSRSNSFLARLMRQHEPALWIFGHHHRDWRYRENKTEFVCCGQLSHVDIDDAGNVHGR